MVWFRRLLGLAFFFACARADAQPSLEYPEGPIVNSNRVLGLGGAYAGIAEGADGHLYNPASFAMRFPYTRRDTWDWDWTVYWLNIPGSRNPDLYDDSEASLHARHGGGGLDFKLAGFGVGIHAYTQGYDIVENNRAVVSVTNWTGGVGLAYALHKIDVVLGSYAYGFTWEFLQPEVEDAKVEITGGGSRIGLLWMPRQTPLRVGIVARSSFDAQSVKGGEAIEAERLPRSVYIPQQLVLGVSYMLGERVYNPVHTWGLGVLERSLSAQGAVRSGRRYVLFAADLVATAASPADAVSMRGFLLGERTASGQQTTVSPHVGVEAEVLANWLVLRGGYYFEPGRAKLPGRHHGTGGLAFRIPFPIYDLRADTAFDLSAQYSNIGVGVGFWH